MTVTFDPLFYGSVDEMWWRALQVVFDHGEWTGSRDGEAMELLGYSATLDASQQMTLVTHPERKLDPVYASAELLWYMSGSSDVSMIRAYAPQYSRFAESDGRAWGAYGRRLKGGDVFRHQLLTYAGQHNTAAWTASQLAAVTEVLRRHPDSRQAQVAMWNEGDLVHAVLGDRRDLPCTTTLQFLLRNGSLHLVATMRSNDLWLGMPYDVYAFTCFQWLVAAELGVRVGAYMHRAGSLHLYGRDQDKARAVLKHGMHSPSGPHGWMNPHGSNFEGRPHVEACLLIEECARSGYREVPPTTISKTPFADAALCCQAKHSPNWELPETTCSPALREAYERRYPR